LRATHLSGIELLPERLAQARSALPSAVTLIEGDALQAAIEPSSQDVVMQSTVFSSLLDDAFQQRLADAMWRWTKPGGAVLWYCRQKFSLVYKIGGFIIFLLTMAITSGAIS